MGYVLWHCEACGRWFERTRHWLSYDNHGWIGSDQNDCKCRAKIAINGPIVAAYLVGGADAISGLVELR